MPDEDSNSELIDNGFPINWTGKKHFVAKFFKWLHKTDKDTNCSCESACRRLAWDLPVHEQDDASSTTKTEWWQLLLLDACFRWPPTRSTNSPSNVRKAAGGVNFEEPRWENDHSWQGKSCCSNPLRNVGSNPQEPIRWGDFKKNVTTILSLSSPRCVLPLYIRFVVKVIKNIVAWTKETFSYFWDKHVHPLDLLESVSSPQNVGFLSCSRFTHTSSFFHSDRLFKWFRIWSWWNCDKLWEEYIENPIYECPSIYYLLTDRSGLCWGVCVWVWGGGRTDHTHTFCILRLTGDCCTTLAVQFNCANIIGLNSEQRHSEHVTRTNWSSSVGMVVFVCDVSEKWFSYCVFHLTK